MKYGIYTVESIESGTVKLLYRKDEMVMELIPLEQFPPRIKEGDIVDVQKKDNGISIIYLENETNAIRERVRNLRAELLERSKDQD